MQKMHFVKKIVYITSFFFFVTGITLLLHRHSLSPEFSGCSICNVKNSFTGSPDKNARDCCFAIALGYGWLPGELPAAPELVGDGACHGPANITRPAYLNKSPPPSFA